MLHFIALHRLWIRLTNVLEDPKALSVVFFVSFRLMSSANITTAHRSFALFVLSVSLYWSCSISGSVSVYALEGAGLRSHFWVKLFLQIYSCLLIPPWSHLHRLWDFTAVISNEFLALLTFILLVLRVTFYTDFRPATAAYCSRSHSCLCRMMGDLVPVRL